MAGKERASELITDYFTHLGTIERMRTGPLGPYIDDFASFLREFGYTTSTIVSKLRLVGQLSEWFAGQQTAGLEALEQKIPEFVAVHDKGHGRIGKTPEHLLGLLRRVGAISEPEPSTLPPPSEAMLIEESFVRYLVEERGLAPLSVAVSARLTRQFLRWQFPDGQLNFSDLTAGDVSSFVLGEASRLKPKSSALIVSTLRSFLRFLHLEGLTGPSLVEGVPTVPDRGRAGLPGYLPPAAVKRLFDNCSRDTVSGRRDFAILTLLARLGLRGGEVLGLTLEDIDWELGELRVRGRPGRTERLPLPVDVGRAIADYLRAGRPKCASRLVFIRVRPPFKGIAFSSLSCVVQRALRRAGLNPPRQGTRLLRHSVATTMLRQGAALSEIGELLRHRHPDTTSIYAKVDLAALKRLALPWPGGA